MSVNYLSAGKLEEAKEWLYKAIGCEKKTGSLLKKIQQLENVILKLTKMEAKMEIKE